jgi:hypothetical protein
MTGKTRPISIRLAASEIEQLHARAHRLSANISGVARDLIRTGLADGDNKAREIIEGFMAELVDRLPE